MEEILIWSGLCIVAYLIGSIPFGYLAGKIIHRKDIRKGGSGNIGATNALRQYGVKTAILVLVLDALKGLSVAWTLFHLVPKIFPWIGSSQPLDPFVAAMPLLMVIVGHMYPVWLGFKGGKGVSTALGVFLIYAPLPLLIALIVFVILSALTKYVSVGSISAALSLFLVHLIWVLLNPGSMDFPWFTLIVIALIIFKHSANILRLLEHRENKLSFKHQEGK